MFDFLKKKVDTNIYAPVKGKCIDITEVDDPGFSSKVMGDGVAIIPEGDVISAPASGSISMIFETGHAFGILADNGAEILVHIGIDTVNMNGEGFTKLKASGDKVKKGDPIIKIDLEKIKAEYDPATMVIMTNGKSFCKPTLNTQVNENSPVFEGIG